jgi:hypothetical protein
MPVRKNRTNGSGPDDEEQRADEQIGRNKEGGARVFGAPHINEGEDGKNQQAECECVWLKFRKGRDQRAHACGDTHRSVQNVVDHEGCGRQKAGDFSQIFCSDGIAAAAVRIGVNRLAVGEVNDRQ